MPTIAISVPHSLPAGEAAERLKIRMADAKESYRGSFSDLSESWNGHQLSYAFTVLGMEVRGTMTVESGAVRLSADLPMAAALLRGTIESQLREEMERLLA